LDDMARRHYGLGLGRKTRSVFKALPLEQAHLKPSGYLPPGGHATYPLGSKQSQSYGLIIANSFAAMMMAVAGINFITLMTARGSRRAVEVGIRKAVGARRRDLVIQFIGEAVLHALLAFVLGLAGAELAVPTCNAIFDLNMGFDYGQDAPLVGLLLVATLAIGAAAGLYPALALSAFRPVLVLKGGPIRLPGSARLRHGLIALQFMPLIALGLVAITTDREFRHANEASLALLDPQTLLIDETCTPALKGAIAALPGVIRIACMPTRQADVVSDGKGVGYLALGRMDDTPTWLADASGKQVDGFMVAGVNYGVMEFHGMKPLAGHLFSPERPQDDDGMVITDNTRRRLGFASPATAVGQDVTELGLGPRRSIRIIGVASDRSRQGDLREALVLKPAAAASDGMGLKLAPTSREATLAAIDRLWAAQGHPQPMKRQTYAEYLRERYSVTYRNVQIMAGCMMVGLFVAAIGLFGLSAFLAEQRTKEIGVRKALGASRGQVLRRLLAQFAWPVILANLITCPVVFGFLAYVQRSEPISQRFMPGPDVFTIVIAGSMLIAFVSVFTHAWQVSSQRPVKALRYE
ncbi:MAG: hypothetical protein JWM33_1140, partial [Caulobacteraceae bacterium]|nr:hypothetical protein [Caulobacteraceae bacterium]